MITFVTLVAFRLKRGTNPSMLFKGVPDSKAMLVSFLLLLLHLLA